MPPSVAGPAAPRTGTRIWLAATGGPDGQAALGDRVDAGQAGGELVGSGRPSLTTSGHCWCLSWMMRPRGSASRVGSQRSRWMHLSNALQVGWVQFSSVVEYSSAADFERDEGRHCVGCDSPYAWRPGARPGHMHRCAPSASGKVRRRPLAADRMPAGP